MDKAIDLFLYELGVLSRTERSGSLLLSLLIAKRVQDPLLEQVLHGLVQESHVHCGNIDACFRRLNTSSMETQAGGVDGIRDEFENFLNIRPSPDLLDLFALHTARRYTAFAIESYNCLISWAMQLDQNLCAGQLQTNLVEKKEGAARLHRISHNLARRMVAAQP